MRGIANFFTIAANIVVTSSAALVTTGLKIKIAANQKVKCRWWVKFTVGATGGVRAQIVLPAGATLSSSIILYNTVAPSITTAVQAASAAFTNALANAGTHWIEIEAEVQNGATAGEIDLQMAQNTSDVLSLTILAGGSMDTLLHN